MESKAARRPDLRDVANAMREIPAIRPVWPSWRGGMQGTDGLLDAGLEGSTTSAWRPGSHTSGSETGQKARIPLAIGSRVRPDRQGPGPAAHVGAVTALARRETPRPLVPARDVTAGRQDINVLGITYGQRSGRGSRGSV